MTLEISDFLKRVDEGPFTVMRWSDGEYCCMVREFAEPLTSGCVAPRSGKNCNGDIYYSGLRDKLLKAWREPKDEILYILNPFEKHIHKIPFNIKNNKFKKCTTDNDSFNAIHSELERGKLLPFIKKIIKKNLVFVGPKFLEHCVIEHKGYIGTGSQNAFDRIEKIKGKILAVARAFDSRKESVFFSISAGMCAKVIIDELFDQIGDRHYLFDAGSLWDPVCNINSRSGHDRIIGSPQLLKNYPQT